MQKWIFISLMLCLVSSFACQKAKVTTAIINSKSGLFLRAESNQNSERIQLIPTGETVTILEKEKDITVIDGKESVWYKVRYNDKSGWVFGAYIIVNDETVIMKNSERNLFCYLNTANNLIISDVNGKKHIPKIKLNKGRYGTLYVGTSNPNISRNNKNLAYFNEDNELSLYNIETGLNISIIDSAGGPGKKTSLRLLFSGWTDNFLLFNLSERPDEEESDENIDKNAIGFYAYSISEKKIKKLPEVMNIVANVPNSDDLIVYSDNEVELKIYNVITGKTCDYVTLNEQYGQLTVFNRNIITYGSYRRLNPNDSKDSEISIKSHSIKDGIVKKVVTGEWAEYQRPEFIFSDRYLVYVHQYKQFNEYIVLYDLKDGSAKELFKAYEKIVLGSKIIYRDNSSLFTYDIFTGEKILIASDVKRLFPYE